MIEIPLIINDVGSTVPRGDSCVRSLALYLEISYLEAQEKLRQGGRKCNFCEWEMDFDLWLMANGFQQVKPRGEREILTFLKGMGASGRWIISGGNYYWAVIDGMIYDRSPHIDLSKRVYQAYRRVE